MIKLATPRPWEGYFQRLSEKLFKALQQEEVLLLSFASETSVSLRLNNAKVRQITDVEDTTLNLDLAIGRNRRATAQVPLTYVTESDVEGGLDLLRKIREEARVMPVDSSVVTPPTGLKSDTRLDEQEFRRDDWMQELLSIIDNRPVYGLLSAGRDLRAVATSTGSYHWFQASQFHFDYSLRAPSGLALKNLFAGHKWDKTALESQLQSQEQMFQLLSQSPRKLNKGIYRVYLAPAAVDDLVRMFSWGGLSEAALRQGNNPMTLLRQGEVALSEQFSLYENALPGVSPRFNEWGELSPENLPLIEKGQLKNTLISARTAKEFNLTSNGATINGEGLMALFGGECVRAGQVTGGSLDAGKAMESLGDGLYISNLHYLNWSDRAKGRITGMTRFGCFVVENGKPVAPFEPLRFDDSIFSLLGSSLEALTSQRELLVQTDTYERRALGGAQVPGALIKEMTFTL